MTETSIPLLMWMGYSNKLVLVSTSHIRHWTAIVSEEPALRVLPRRWVDIRGERIADIWDAGLKAVMGTLIFRPGITLVSIFKADESCLMRDRWSCDGGFEQFMTDRN